MRDRIRRLTILCSEPGHRVTVTIIASRGPGLRAWGVRPLNHFPSDYENRRMKVLKSLAYSSYH
jgi:hypothetical protein